MGWLVVKANDYARPMRRLALRWRKLIEQRYHALLISTPGPPAEVLKMRKYGVQRVVRDVLVVSGFLELGKGAAIKWMVLNGGSGDSVCVR